MRDPRVHKLADVLVHYSTAVKEGDVVMIGGSHVGLPLVTAVYEKVIQAGANAHVALRPDECGEILLREGSDAQLLFADPISQFAVENIDVRIAFWGAENTKALSRYDPAKQSKVSQGRKQFMEAFLRRAAKKELRWVGTQFPCQASAQDAEMSLSQYEDFVFRAS